MGDVAQLPEAQGKKSEEIGIDIFGAVISAPFSYGSAWRGNINTNLQIVV